VQGSSSHDKEAWKVMNKVAAMGGAYLILYSWAALMAAHATPLLQASIGDVCPIIQRYKSFQLAMESWLTLFKILLENHQQTDEVQIVPVEEADDFFSTNEKLFNDTFKWG